MRSLILAGGSCTETFDGPNIQVRFQHSPDEQADQQGTEIEPIVSEKRLHVPSPLLGNS